MDGLRLRASRYSGQVGAQARQAASGRALDQGRSETVNMISPFRDETKTWLRRAERAELARKVSMLGLADPGAAPFAHAALLLCCFDPPKLVFRAERPTTDFLGTGAGPMAF